MSAATALLAAALAPAAGQAPPPSPRPAASSRIQLTAPVQQTLLGLQEQWLQWIGAFYQHRERTAEVVVAGLSTSARRMGMARLPDLALAALVPAVDAAREGDFERARWALDAAERLDPGRAETAFAAAHVAAGQRSYLRAAGNYLLAYARLFTQPWLKAVWLHHLVSWTWTALVATGLLSLAVLMATRGRRLFSALAGRLGKRLPRPLALALALALLAAPAALPYGAAWLVLLWVALLWAYVSPSERVVLAVVLLLVGAAPFLAAEQERRVTVAVSPPARAIESVANGQLYGDLFSDLEALRAALPESTAVLHLVADLHRRLGQWDLARTLYLEVLDREPQNAAALLDLGVHYFGKGDFALAIQHFQQAAAADARSAAALFNLSQAYSESYLFDEQHRAIEQARAIDNDRVTAWLSSQQRVVVADGGLARIPELRRELLAAHSAVPVPAGASRTGGPLGRALGIVLAAGAVLGAAAVRRKLGSDDEPDAAWPSRPSRRDPWLRAFLPGCATAASGEGGRSFLALLVPVALLLLPLGGRIGYEVPWGYDPGDLVPRALAVVGILVYLAARLTWELRNRV